MINNKNFLDPSSSRQWFSKTHWSKQFNETFSDWKLFIFKWPEYLFFALLYLVDIVVIFSIAVVVGITLPLLTFIGMFGIIPALQHFKKIGDNSSVRRQLYNAIKVTINAIYKLWCNFRGFLLDICNSITSPIDSLSNSATLISLKLIGGIIVATLFTLGVIFSGGSVIPLAIVIKPFVLLMSPVVTFIANWVGLLAAQVILGYITITVGLLLGQKIVSWIGAIGEKISSSKFQVDKKNGPTTLQQVGVTQADEKYQYAPTQHVPLSFSEYKKWVKYCAYFGISYGELFQKGLTDEAAVNAGFNNISQEMHLDENSLNDENLKISANKMWSEFLEEFTPPKNELLDFFRKGGIIPPIKDLLKEEQTSLKFEHEGGIWSIGNWQFKKNLLAHERDIRPVRAQLMGGVHRDEKEGTTPIASLIVANSGIGLSSPLTTSPDPSVSQPTTEPHTGLQL